MAISISSSQQSGQIISDLCTSPIQRANMQATTSRIGGVDAGANIAQDIVAMLQLSKL